MEEDVRSREFADFYQDHADFVYGIALSYLHSPQEAEDITSEVFLTALEHGITFPEPQEARAWLTTVTCNRCRNVLRSWQRKKRMEISEAIPLPDEAVSPEQQLQLRETMEKLLQLPERYRLPLLLVGVYGYTAGEAGKLLHLNESTVRTRLARARKIIREALGGK